MKIIELSGKYGSGKVALVDDSDFDELNNWKWFLTTHGYAARTIHSKRPNRTDKTMFMHIQINKTPKGFFTDHINRNKLDNRRENLRTVTNTQNQLNKGFQKNNTSGIIGVCLHKPNNKWWARIWVNRKMISLGCYINMEDAIKARQEAEKKYL